MIKSNDMMSVDDVVEILSAKLIGIIPEDTGIITSTNKGEPIVNDEKSLAGRAYKNVAQRIRAMMFHILIWKQKQVSLLSLKNS